VPGKLLWSPAPERHAGDLPNVGIRGDYLYHAHVLPEDDEKRYALPPPIMAIDPSGRGADETGYAIGSAMNGYHFLLDAGGVAGVSDEHIDALCHLALQWGVKTFVVEPNYGGGMFNKVLESALQRNRVTAGIIDAPWATGRKEKRIIETLYPVVAGHRLVVNTNLFRRDASSVQHLPADKGIHRRLWHQFTHLSHMPGSLVHDDRLEAVAIMCAHLSTNVSIDVNKELERNAEEEWEKEIEKFLRAAGRSQKQDKRANRLRR
jgi:hypothetical protein